MRAAYSMRSDTKTTCWALDKSKASMADAIQGLALTPILLKRINANPQDHSSKIAWIFQLNPLRLQYVILRMKSQNRCDSCMYIYVHRLCDQNIGLLPASNQGITFEKARRATNRSLKMTIWSPGSDLC